ncbi:MAG: electron transfer flavoprotein-ubiquinone oxidoreductase [Alphaproteobacteria bacterium]|nr:electron transfer flavoprotein-ubiquinone oxidoreductase [Alphaproteobacteria bacterium]
MSEQTQPTEEQIETMDCDVLIVGAGPSGLSAAIRLKQLANEQNQSLEVVVVEKGSEVGAHILSGACIETRALDELIPDWKDKGAPLTVEATHDEFIFLSEKGSIKLPTPPQMHNKGNYIVSLGNFARWLGQQAEALGVQVFAGFPAADLEIEGGNVTGILTGAFGIGKDGTKKAGYQPPMRLKAKYTIFAEGCRGSLSQRLMETFDLRKGINPQTYGLGIKELWEVAPEKHKQGTVTHTVGWPMDNKAYGGSFIYHAENNQVAIGYVVGLDYENPYLDPYMEFQRFKTHPKIKTLLEGGRRIAYGARALNEGGVQSIPKLAFNGGVLTGCAAGFLNVPKIKGTHTAMKTGMLAAESIFAALGEGRSHDTVTAYEEAFKASWVYEELYKVRNIRPSFKSGLLLGLLYAGIDTLLLRGKAPWTLQHAHSDNKATRKAKSSKKITYPKPDGVLTFDRMSSVFLSNTNHEEDQPCHLRLKDSSIPINYNLPEYAEPAQRYCPAGVYEVVEENGKPRFQINAQNCVHCKTCDIKDPKQNIVWVTPEGGGGPNYPNM